MGKKQNIIKYTAACMMFAFLGVYVGYTRITRTPYSEVPYDSIEEVETTNLTLDSREVDRYDNSIRIGWQTEIIYEHYDINSGETQILKSSAPNFMINKTQEEVANSFNQWEIMSFNDNEVVMRRTINREPQPEFTLGVTGEFLAIFYGDGSDGNIMEITNIPVSALPREEQERLGKGIFIYDQDELIRRLEDYSS